MASYHAQTSVDPECCQRKCHTFCAWRDCPPSLVPWLKRQHQCLRLNFSPGVNGMFIYSDLCWQIQNALLTLVKFNGIVLMTQGIQGQSLHFRFQLVLPWVWIESYFSNIQRTHMMWSELIDSLLIDQTGPFKHYQRSCNIARVPYNGDESWLWMWEESTEKTKPRQINSSSQPERNQMFKDAQNLFKNPNLVWWKRRINSCMLM